MSKIISFESILTNILYMFYIPISIFLIAQRESEINYYYYCCCCYYYYYYMDCLKQYIMTKTHLASDKRMPNAVVLSLRAAKTGHYQVDYYLTKHSLLQFMATPRTATTTDL